MEEDASTRPAVAPLYARIASELRDRILDGSYGPGALLPSRNEIAAQFEVSAITAQHALAILRHEGHAQVITGRGHVVRRARPRLTIHARLYGEALGAGPADTLLHKADIYREPLPEDIALPLEASAEETVWVWHAIWAATADRKPVRIHVSWLPGLGQDAEDAIRAISPDLPWPEAIRQITGRAVGTVRQHTHARGASPPEAEAFQIPAGTTVLVCQATTYDAGHAPIEHSRYAWPVEAIRMSDYYKYGPGS